MFEINSKWIILFSLLYISLREIQSVNGNNKHIICYHASWAVYGKGVAKFSVENIDPKLCTHVVYVYADFDNAYNIKPKDEYAAFKLNGYTKFTELKKQNEKLKTLLSIGAWDVGSAKFSTLVASSENRSTFIDNLIEHLRQHNFDGIVMHWEYPAARDGNSKADKRNFAKLMNEIYTKFRDEGKKTKKNRLVVSTVLSHYTEFINNGYDIPTISKYTDFMIAFTYEYSTNTKTIIHFSALYGFSEKSISQLNSDINANFTIQYLIEKGADPHKLIIMVPTQGKSFTLEDAKNHKYGSLSSGDGKKGKYTDQEGSLAYFEICDLIKNQNWKVERPEKKSLAPYIYRGDQWVCYDDIETVELKSKYIVENGLGGIAFQYIGNDDFSGKCNGKPFPLIAKAKEIFHKNKPKKENSTSPEYSTGNQPKPPPTLSTRKLCVIPRDMQSTRFWATCDESNNAIPPDTNVTRGCTLNVTCTEGYSLPTKSSLSICSGTTWLPEIPQCQKKCQSPEIKYASLTCYSNSEETSCEKNVFVNGSKATIRCQPHYRLDYLTPYGRPDNNIDVFCKETGEWNIPYVKCVPECGKLYQNGNPLISDGHEEKYGDSPWHVAVYRKNTHQLICGGTIVSPHIAVSAAHCFYDSVTDAQRNPSTFEIVVGKYSRNYTINDNPQQKSYEIKEIRFPNSGFFGAKTNYDNDIALVILEERIAFSATILPACIDWRATNFDPGEGTLGKVAGWGMDGSERYSDVLLSASLSFLSRISCMSVVGEDFQSLITLDKFCAGNRSVSKVHKGDSGGGFLFRETTLYYLRGVVSVELTDPSSTNVFTDISAHINWISRVFTEVED